MDAIYFREGKISNRLPLIRSITASLSIGSGASLGWKRPIGHISAGLVSLLNKIVEIPIRQKIVLIAAATGAGIGATFNAPIAGILFAVELLLISVNPINISIVCIASVVATYFGRFLLGNYPVINVSSMSSISPSLHAPFSSILIFIILGILIGLISLLFIKIVYWSEKYFSIFLKMTIYEILWAC